MFGGRIKKDGTYVEGSLKQFAWHDESLSEHEIIYEGEITDDVEAAIRKAWYNAEENRAESSWGKLRWSAGRSIEEIDRQRKVVIALKCTRLSD